MQRSHHVQYIGIHPPPVTPGQPGVRKSVNSSNNARVSGTQHKINITKVTKL